MTYVYFNHQHMHIIDKRLRAEQFRNRLGQALQNAGMTQSDLARATRINRSTVSQLLSGTAARLPNAQVIGACAAALRVSADWCYRCQTGLKVPQTFWQMR